MIRDFIRFESFENKGAKRYDFLVSASCDCGCEYFDSFVVTDEMLGYGYKATLALHKESYERIGRWLKNDKHGDQRRPIFVMNARERGIDQTFGADLREG